jgi:pimeloyl-ACP methyl ester carboxylesterase
MAHHNGVDIAYETIGDPSGEPMVLIMGLTAQMLGWPDGFCHALADQGFHVVRFDNRDCGLSTHFRYVPTPGWRSMRSGAGAPYTLGDMADDAVAVMDSLGWASAHVAGLSMGGMIAQILATRHPDRVRSLTSFMASPSVRIGQMKVSTILRMVLLSRRIGEPTNAEEAGRNIVEFLRVTSSPGYPFDEERYFELGRRSYERDPDPGDAGHRQHAAMRASGDRRRELANLRVPTLVIQGDSDIVVHPVAGRAAADAVPGARLVTYPGLGHELPRELWPAFAGEMRALADRAPAPASDRPAQPPAAQLPATPSGRNRMNRMNRMNRLNRTKAKSRKSTRLAPVMALVGVAVGAVTLSSIRRAGTARLPLRRGGLPRQYR